MDEQQHIQVELAELREEQRRLAASLGTDQAGDTADQADGIERAEELHRVSRRIDELRDRLRAGPGGAAFLPIGTRAELRYPDGASERIEVGYAAHEASSVTTITADSPLARALRGRAPGDTIHWQTPAGVLSAQLVSVVAPDTT